MIAKELLDILVCPETRQPLREAPADVLERLNAAIGQGTLVNRSGQRVEQRLPGGLVREDGLVLYPIVDDIPIMLEGESIILDSATFGAG
ncbi:MAG: Trm112 family protein [Pirellulales bacterium]